MNIRKFSSGRFVIVIAALLATLRAQDLPYGHGLIWNTTTGNLHNNSYSSLIDTQMFHTAQLQQMYARHDRQRRDQEAAEQRRLSFENFMAASRERLARLSMGQARIANGLASTKFSRNPKTSGLNALLSNVKKESDRVRITEAYPRHLEGFQRALEKAGFAEHDVADACALAFVINYRTFRGVEPSRVHLENVRNTARAGFLKDAWLQSFDDAEWQVGVEAISALTMYAASAEATPEDAKLVSAEILTRLWGAPAKRIAMTADGFEDHVLRRIAEGQGTTTFTANPEASKLAELAKNDWRKQSLASMKKALSKFEARLEAAGYPRSDLVFAAITAGEICHEVITQGKPLSPKQRQDLEVYFRDKLKNSVEVPAADDAERQAAFEEFAVTVQATWDRVQSLTRKLNSPANDTYERELQRIHRSSIESEAAFARSLIERLLAPDKLSDFDLDESGFRRRAKPKGQ